MPFSDKWTQAQLLAAGRRTLADPSGRFWGDSELNNYIDEWQQSLQGQFEFVWGSATTTTTASTFALATVASDALRLDAVYWNGKRLSGRSKQNLDDITREWRTTTAVAKRVPEVVYQDDSLTFSLYPPPGTVTAGTMVLEYPIRTTFATTTSTMQIPAWTRYSCKDYIAYKAHLREGPANNPTKALRYKQRYEKGVRRFRTIWDSYFPGKYLRLQPASTYESNIILGRTG